MYLPRLGGKENYTAATIITHFILHLISLLICRQLISSQIIEVKSC
jgi:hypothetical protein